MEDFLIKRLVKLKNFGSFEDFNNDDKELSFKKFNLFYGYNGSGKTTLTRLFSCLNKGELPEDYGDVQFKIELEGEKPITGFSKNSSLSKKIKIFNSDFVDENLELKKGKAKKLVVIGNENISLKNEIEDLEKKKNELYDGKGKLKATEFVEKARKELENYYSDIAKDIKRDLSLNNNDYKSDKFKNDFNTFSKESPS